MALLLVGVVGVGQQAVAVAAVGVVRDPAVLEQWQAEIGVLDRWCRSTSRRRASIAARRIRHIVPCTMMALTSLRCTMPMSKKPAYSRVHGVVHQRAVAVAVILRRLHEADARIGEQRHQVLQPVRLHDIVGVDDADDLGIGRGVLQRDAQRAGLEAVSFSSVDELEALAERRGNAPRSAARTPDRACC